MIYVTSINFEAYNLGYAEDVEAAFYITYEPALFSDEQDACDAEFDHVEFGRLRLNMEQFRDMIGADQLNAIEAMVGRQWYETERHEVQE